MAEDYVCILSTFPSLEKAEEVSDFLISKKLAACVSLKKVKSLYYWQGKKHKEKEILAEIKTKALYVKEIDNLFKKNHPYEVYQFIVVNISYISKDYQLWIDNYLSGS